MAQFSEINLKSIIKKSLNKSAKVIGFPFRLFIDSSGYI